MRVTVQITVDDSTTMDDVCVRVFGAVYEYCGGNLVRAATTLGIGREKARRLRDRGRDQRRRVQNPAAYYCRGGV